MAEISARRRLAGWLSDRRLRLGLGIAASVVALYLALQDVSLGEVRVALAQANAGWIGLALASVAVNTLAKAIRWQVLLGPAGKKIGVGRALVALLIGQMLNTLLPARVGDLTRAYQVGSQGAGRTFTLATVMVEKILDLLSYAFLFVFLIFLIPLPGWVSDSGYGFVGVTVFVALAVFVATYQQAAIVRLVEWGARILPEQSRVWVTSRLRAALASLDVLQSHSDLFRLAFWSALAWATAVLNNHLVLLALGLHLPLAASLLTLIALQAGISIPSAPGRIGIFEYICMLALAVFGVDQAVAFGYGLVLHAVVLLPTTLIGLVFWLWGIGGSRVELAKAVEG
jgi:glycosyltransferase 2 family protein